MSIHTKVVQFLHSSWYVSLTDFISHMVRQLKSIQTSDCHLSWETFFPKGQNPFKKQEHSMRVPTLCCGMIDKVQKFQDEKGE